MRKMIALLVMASFTVGLVGCGEKPAAKPPAAPPAAKDGEKKEAAPAPAGEKKDEKTK